MKRRSGVTLVEVLVAIFVMGIGLIALLTLFPIGMLRMARAIHDEYSTQSAINGYSNAILYNLGQDADVNSETNDLYNRQPPAFAIRPNTDLFLNPMPRNSTAPFAQVLLSADLTSESYPIFVDPIGFYNVGVPARD